MDDGQNQKRQSEFIKLCSNNLTMLSVDDCTDSADWDILDHVVINTLNMNRAQGLINKPCV
jgi:hypothetical protein